MGARLVMLAVIDARITPSLIAVGRESATRVKGLGEGEKLEMEVISRTGEDSRVVPLSEGVHPLPSPLKRGDMFKIKKMVGGVSATTVEVILSNGVNSLF